MPGPLAAQPAGFCYLSALRHPLLLLVSPEAKPLPFYQLMDAFEAFTHGQPDVKPQHRSLYYFLLGYARKRGNVPRFVLPYEVGMDGSRIGSWATYDAAIKALAAWGFIVYVPGANRYKVPVVELTFRNPSGDELLSYWQAYCLAYPVELQNRNPSPPLELQNQSSSPVIELQNCSSTDNSTANPSGDIKKSIRDREHETTASAEGEQDSFQNQNSPASLIPSAGKATKPSPVLGPSLNVPFADFWQAYGKKVGRHKSELKWKALTSTERTAALAAVPAYVARKHELQYRKDPLSWLNGKHWEDELPEEGALAARPAPQPQPVGPPPITQPDLNAEVVNQRQAPRDAAAAAARRRVRAASAAS